MASFPYILSLSRAFKKLFEINIGSRNGNEGLYAFSLPRLSASIEASVINIGCFFLIYILP
jgi:hypothetical protein